MRGELLTFKVRGFKELDDALKNFPLELQRKALDGATRAGAKIVEREAKARWDRQGVEDIVTGMAQTRNRTGLTRRNIRVVKAKKGSVKSSTYYCTISRYGMFIELGTKGHWIKAKKAKVMARRTISFNTERNTLWGASLGFDIHRVREGWQVFGKKVRHPGTVPKPFLRPAFYNNIDRIIDTERNYISAWIRKTYYRGRSSFPSGVFGIRVRG